MLRMVAREGSLTRISHTPRGNVAHAPCVPCRDYLDTVAGQQHSVESWRRQECRRGTQSACATLRGSNVRNAG